jgi:hypothetical protein
MKISWFTLGAISKFIDAKTYPRLILMDELSALATCSVAVKTMVPTSIFLRKIANK